MDSATRGRWALLLGALVVTVIAAVAPVDPRGDAVIGPVAPRVVVPGSPDIPSEDGARLAAWRPTPIAAFAGEDPFALRGWEAPKPALIVAPPPIVLAPAPVPVAPVVPPLPFRYLGRMDGLDGEVLYLGRGDQTLVVRVNDVLDGEYRLVAASARQLEFQHLATGTRRTLDLAAAS